jgi:hypothetical protein
MPSGDAGNNFGDDPDGTPFRIQWDDLTSIHLDLVRAVAAFRDVEARSPPSLQETLDVDALETLVHSPGEIHVTFHYEGCEIVVTSDREILLWRVEGDDREQ